MSKPRPFAPGQAGASLAVALFMLVVTMLLGVSGARIALQEEKAAYSERDRQLAFAAAEEALRDAELDIDGQGHGQGEQSRGAPFSSTSLEGFAEDCAARGRSGVLGLRLPAIDGSPAWRQADLLAGPNADGCSVPYGSFTGRTLAVQSSAAAGKGNLPARPPRYIIEPLVFNKPGEAADLPGKSHFFLITAIGFGARESTEVVVQSLYRKQE